MLHTFGATDDGSFPVAGLVADAGFKTLYGTTNAGGPSDLGSVFRLTSSAKGWAETVIHSFGASNDGYQPQAALVEYGSGTIFGTTPFGGQYVGGENFPAGRVFEN